MTPQQFLLVVWAWRKLAIAVTAATIVIVLVVSLVMPKTYTASTSILVDVTPDPVLGMVLPAMGSPAYLATQTEIIQSTRVATRVAKILRISEVPSVFESWKKDTGGKISLEEYYGTLLLRGLAVQPGRGSNIITVTFASSDARFAAAVANAFAQAYVETSVELRVDPARQYAAWFDERLKTLRDNLEQAQTRLSNFQKESGIVVTDGRLDQETARLDALNDQLAAAQAQKADVSSREKSAGGELSPDAMSSPVVQGIQADIAKAQANLAQISSNVGKNNPQRVQLEAQIAALKDQMAREVQRISGGVAAASRVSTQKAAELQTAIDIQKKRVLDLRAQHDKIAILVKDVQTAQDAYEGVAKRMSQMSLESHSQQANVSILSPATEPTSASKPRILANVIASIFGGLLLGIGAAVGREFLDRRVRGRDDLLAIEGVPVLGVMRAKTEYRFLKGRLASVLDWLVRRAQRRAAAGAAA